MTVMKVVPNRVILHEGATATGSGDVISCMSVSGGTLNTVAFSVEGISGDTITFEVTMDDTNWYALRATGVTSGTVATTATADGLYTATVTGMLNARARISTYSAGTITIIAVVT